MYILWVDKMDSISHQVINACNNTPTRINYLHEHQQGKKTCQASDCPNKPGLIYQFILYQSHYVIVGPIVLISVLNLKKPIFANSGV